MTKSYLCFFISVAFLGGPTYGQVGAGERVLGRYTVKSIKFIFTDKRTYKDKRLLGKLGFKEGETIDAVLAEFGREDLSELYLEKGFAFVDVTLDADKLPEGKVVYTITEGPRVKIKSVRLVGNNALRKGTLRKGLKAAKKEWFLWPTHYSQERLIEDTEKLEDLYWGRGYLDCTVTAKEQFNKDRSRVHITFVIDEGPIYRIAQTSISGAQKLYQVDTNGRLDEQALRAKLKVEPGQTYRKRQAESDRRMLLKLCRENGFVDAVVNLQLDKIIGEEAEATTVPSVSQRQVHVNFKISEGQQFRIGKIDIMGNQQTQDKVVRRVLDGYDFQPGRWFNAEVVRGDGSGELEADVRRKVYAQEATITPVPGYGPDQKNAEVEIKEGQTGSAMLGAGFSSDRGVIGSVILEQRNFDISDWPDSLAQFITGQAFRGAGQSLRIALEPGTEFSQYSINFNEPYFRDQPISLDVTGLDSEWARESYDEGRTKGYVGFAERYERRSRDRWRRNIGFRIENVDVLSLESDAPQEIRDVAGDNLLAGVRLGIGKELTDNSFMPTEGYGIKGSYEQVTGDHTFGIMSGTYTWYRPIYEDLAERKTIVVTRIHAGTMLGDAPPFGCKPTSPTPREKIP
jgi:outer membrane protein assembly factor BamA